MCYSSTARVLFFYCACAILLLRVCYSSTARVLFFYCACAILLLHMCYSSTAHVHILLLGAVPQSKCSAGRLATQCGSAVPLRAHWCHSAVSRDWQSVRASKLDLAWGEGARGKGAPPEMRKLSLPDVSPGRDPGAGGGRPAGRCPAQSLGTQPGQLLLGSPA